MPCALNLMLDPDTLLYIERVFASLNGIGIADNQLVTHHGPCVTLLVVDDSIPTDDVMETLRRLVPGAEVIPLTLTEPCIIQGSPPTLSLRASPAPCLLDLHYAIFQSLPARAVHLHYRPAYWQPHLKLANVSANPDVSGRLVTALAAAWQSARGKLIAVEAVRYSPIEAIWHGRLRDVTEVAGHAP